ncbi:hypothetical protein BDE02_11G122600 [Populus trichocarpa]|nr:hypothetical protein BDE02_11G122600 [Populus trichocarpa]
MDNFMWVNIFKEPYVNDLSRKIWNKRRRTRGGKEGFL